MIIFKWKFKSTKKNHSARLTHIGMLRLLQKCPMTSIYIVSWDICINLHKDLTLLLQVLTFLLHHHLAISNAEAERKTSFFNVQKAPEEPANSNENFGLNSQFSHHLVIVFSQA